MSWLETIHAGLAATSECQRRRDPTLMLCCDSPTDPLHLQGSVISLSLLDNSDIDNSG